MLSDKAEIDTKPQLEVQADDVKAAHGATIGQLNDDEMFYLQTRGIDKNSARKILSKAFALEVLDTYPNNQLSKTIKYDLRNRIKDATHES